jgi:hypothetical protein
MLQLLLNIGVSVFWTVLFVPVAYQANMRYFVCMLDNFAFCRWETEAQVKMQIHQHYRLSFHKVCAKLDFFKPSLA